jgi:hypothetical protein
MAVSYTGKHGLWEWIFQFDLHDRYINIVGEKWKKIFASNICSIMEKNENAGKNINIKYVGSLYIGLQYFMKEIFNFMLRVFFLISLFSRSKTYISNHSQTDFNKTGFIFRFFPKKYWKFKWWLTGNKKR